MRVALAIARREVGALFGQPLAYVVLAAFLTLTATLGLRGFFERNVADLQGYFGAQRLSLMLLAPALTMRLWAEERRTGTIELLLTLPVRPLEAVLGKLAASVALLGAALALGAVLPLSLGLLGDLDAGQVAAGYLGTLLLGTTYLALGLLASALTRSQVVAFVLGALACALLGALGDPLLLEPAGKLLQRWVVALLASFGVAPRHDALARGLVDLRDLAYFAGLLAALLFWNVLAVERREGSAATPAEAALEPAPLPASRQASPAGAPATPTTPATSATSATSATPGGPPAGPEAAPGPAAAGDREPAAAARSGAERAAPGRPAAGPRRWTWPRRVALEVALSALALALWVDVTQARPFALRLDATARGVHTLAAPTLASLARLQDRLTVRAYLSDALPEATRPAVRDLLDLLHEVRAAGGGRVALEVVDPGAEPGLAAEAERDGVTRFELEVVDGERRELVPVYAGVALRYGDRPSASIPMALGRPNLEYDVALCLRQLVRRRLALGLAGRGLEDYGGLRAALARAYTVLDLDLSAARAVPDDVDLVLYAAPVPPPEREVYVLDQYLARGGRVVLLAEGHEIDPARWEARPFAQVVDDGPLARALAAWGVRLGPALVLELPQRTWPLQVEGAQVQAAYPWFLCPAGAGQEGAVASGLGRLFLPFASELGWAGEPAPGVERSALLASDPAWTAAGVLPIDPRQRYRLDPADQRPRLLAAGVRGPLGSAWAGRPSPVLAPEAGGGGEDPLAVPLAAPAAPARLAVVGDTDLVRDRYAAIGEGAAVAQGVALLLNLVEWCLDEEGLAAIRAREAARPLEPDVAVPGLAVTVRDVVRVGNVLVLPGLVLALGLVRLELARRRREGAAEKR